MNLNNSVPRIDRDNRSFNSHLQELLVDNWTTEIHYEKYFAQCAPTFCSYVKNTDVNVYYATTMLISLYGGFTILLRLITPHLTTLLVNRIIRRRGPRSKDSSVSSISAKFSSVAPALTRLRTYGRSLKQLNVFETATDRTSHGIEQQRRITRVYLVLLIGNTPIRSCPVNRLVSPQVRPSFSSFSIRSTQTQ